jgi:adenine-specific DNA-methyltransferase
MESFLLNLEELRLRTTAGLNAGRQALLGQYFTPISVAQYMASLLGPCPSHVSILDAGAGIGMLFASAIIELCQRLDHPETINVIAYELDSQLATQARKTLADCMRIARSFGVIVTGEVRNTDFIADSARLLTTNLLSQDISPKFDIIVINPPYQKITASSPERRSLSTLGIETTNLYTGFLELSIRHLKDQGQIIAITPRSFCNGSYFRRFREYLLCQTALTHLHLFENRTDAFRDNSVLQESLIFRVIKNKKDIKTISVSHLRLPLGKEVSEDIPISEIIHHDDSEKFIRIPDKNAKCSNFPFRTSLKELQIAVSTGRVVDFRAASFLRFDPSCDTMPLLYPIHCPDGDISWPILGGKKPNALFSAPETNSLSIPNGNYVLVKRFSAKEQPRRIMASLYEASWFPEADAFGLGLENHLNYFHKQGRGLECTLARGLTLYLSATCVDSYFRRFSGHTQVNATDLRNIPYPAQDQLNLLGKRMGNTFPSQVTIDQWVMEIA